MTVEKSSNPEIEVFCKYSGLDVSDFSFLQANILRDQILEDTDSVSRKEFDITSAFTEKDELIDKEIEKNKIFTRLIGRSEKIKKLRRSIYCVKDKSCKILISGESGTGKSLVARILHETGFLKDKQIISVNVGAIQKDLIESTLFGSVKGAFTDAVDRKGLMTLADGGVLFLDEIAELPLSCQPKLLRAIEEGVYRRVGSDKEEKIDCQFIFATNQNLKELVKKKRFREDLYYRIAEYRIEVPPLRERKEDILMLADYFLQNANSKSSLERKYFTDEAKEKLLSYNWPGNIRELRTIVNVSTIYSQTAKILPCDIIF